MTLEEAKSLHFGQVVYHVYNSNADASPQRWRVNGTAKTWKTRPNEVRVPIKHGLRSFNYLTHRNLHLLELTEEKARAHRAEPA